MTTSSGGIPSVGDKVLTVEGQELGKVKELAESCFKVDAPLQPDYWLATDCILETSPMGVRLRFTKDGLDDAKQDGPEHTGYHRHN